MLDTLCRSSSSRSLSDIRQRLQEVMRTIDETLQYSETVTATTTPTTTTASATHTFTSTTLNRYASRPADLVEALMASPDSAWKAPSTTLDNYKEGNRAENPPATVALQPPPPLLQFPPACLQDVGSLNATATAVTCSSSPLRRADLDRSILQHETQPSSPAAAAVTAGLTGAARGPPPNLIPSDANERVGGPYAPTAAAPMRTSERRAGEVSLDLESGDHARPRFHVTSNIDHQPPHNAMTVPSPLGLRRPPSPPLVPRACKDECRTAEDREGVVKSPLGLIMSLERRKQQIEREGAGSKLLLALWESRYRQDLRTIEDSKALSLLPALMPSVRNSSQGVPVAQAHGLIQERVTGVYPAPRPSRRREVRGRSAPLLQRRSPVFRPVADQRVLTYSRDTTSVMTDSDIATSQQTGTPHSAMGVTGSATHHVDPFVAAFGQLPPTEEQIESLSVRELRDLLKGLVAGAGNACSSNGLLAPPPTSIPSEPPRRPAPALHHIRCRDATVEECHLSEVLSDAEVEETALPNSPRDKRSGGNIQDGRRPSSPQSQTWEAVESVPLHHPHDSPSPRRSGSTAGWPRQWSSLVPSTAADRERDLLLSPLDSRLPEQPVRLRVSPTRQGNFCSDAAPPNGDGGPNHSSLDGTVTATASRQTNDFSPPRLPSAQSPAVCPRSPRDSLIQHQSMEPVQLRQRDATARASQVQAVHVFSDRGLPVDVHIRGRHVPAVVRLSKDLSELQFLVGKIMRSVQSTTTSQSGSLQSQRLTQASMAPLKPQPHCSSVEQHRRPLRPPSTLRGHSPPPPESPPPVTCQRQPPSIAPVGPHILSCYPNTASLAPEARSIRQHIPSSTQPVNRSPTLPHPVAVMRHPPGRHDTRIQSSPVPPSADGKVSSERGPSRPPKPPQHSTLSSQATAAGTPPNLLPHQMELSPSQMKPLQQTASRQSRANAHTRPSRIRELHHFPLKHARVYLPHSVLGYEAPHATRPGTCGPGSWEDVEGILCGPAAFEVLRRYACPLFAAVRYPEYHPYRVYVIIPEFMRIDNPREAVLLVLDFRTRPDMVAFVLALTSLRGRVLSYGRVLWLLAVRLIHRSRALRGLNPFAMAEEMEAKANGRANPVPGSASSRGGCTVVPLSRHHPTPRMYLQGPRTSAHDEGTEQHNPPPCGNSSVSPCVPSPFDFRTEDTICLSQGRSYLGNRPSNPHHSPQQRRAASSRSTSAKELLTPERFGIEKMPPPHGATPRRFQVPSRDKVETPEFGEHQFLRGP